eukprot:TRINITY_DN12205_c0_g1_i1.p1 TRINITY_DN12205_c0_g1~~TRINITY_DN12205_c0_g1_i1.p1  ORF type:complete len:323 (-),score=86.01 TRINITY_DN12205_c0_g1_i1:78-1046(-)
MTAGTLSFVSSSLCAVTSWPPLLHRNTSQQGTSLGGITCSLVDGASAKVDKVLRTVGVDVDDKRIALVRAIGLQAARQSEKALQSFSVEAVKYINPRRSDANSLEEVLMSVPDLETIPYELLRREKEYEVRQVKSFVIAETEMQSRKGFDFMGSSQAFNTLAGYLFGKNKRREEMEMTTPVVTTSSWSGSRGEEMEMTTPVLSQQREGDAGWRMAFVMPSKYGEDRLPVPDDPSVAIRVIPSRIMAAVAFSGYVTDEDVKRRERELRAALANDKEVRVKAGAVVEVAQYNPPFTPPFLRRNEIAMEVEWAGNATNEGPEIGA